MRILSSFHDYYDTAQGLGYDPNLLYRREIQTRQVRAQDLDPCVTDILAKDPSSWNYRANLVVVGFCGRLYPYFLRPRFVLQSDILATRLDESPTMTRQDLDEHYREWVGEERDTKWSQSAKLRRWAALDHQGVPAAQESFRYLNAPIWLAKSAGYWYSRPDHLTVYTNIRLANFEFQKHFDAYTAYQEIALYLGSTLAAVDETARTVGSDEVLARQKGFDQQSFRKTPPSEQKARRRANRARKRSGMQ